MLWQYDVLQAEMKQLEDEKDRLEFENHQLESDKDQLQREKDFLEVRLQDLKPLVRVLGMGPVTRYAPVGAQPRHWTLARSGAHP